VAVVLRARLRPFYRREMHPLGTKTAYAVLVGGNIDEFYHARGELYIVFGAMTGRAVSSIAHASSPNGFRRKAKRVAFQNSGANRDLGLN
jgi:hypothetical protein